MSYEVSVFTRGCTKAALLELLSARFNTHASVEQTEFGCRALAHVFGVDVTVLSGHGLDDDGGLSFTSYLTQASFKVYAGRMDPEAGQDLCRGLALAFARAVRDYLGGEYLVVEGLQVALEESAQQ